MRPPSPRLSSIVGLPLSALALEAAIKGQSIGWILFFSLTIAFYSYVLAAEI